MSQNAFGAFDDSTVSAAALLSAVAWPESLGNNTLGTYLKNNNWSLASIPGFPSDSQGYYSNNTAHAFAATKGDTLAISIRGIEGDSDIYGAALSVFHPLTNYKALLPFINAAVSYVQNNQNINKLLITGASGGGEIADLLVATPDKVNVLTPDLSSPTADISAQLAFNVAPPNLGKFTPANISIVTFGSPGIPPANTSPLRDRVLDIYNTGDFVYNHTLEASGLKTLGFIHVGTPEPLYTPLTDRAHNPALYSTEIQALASSTLFKSSGSQTTFVFGFSNDTIDVNNTTLRIPPGPHFLVGLGGTGNLIGASGDSILAWSGDHVITGGGQGPNRYEIITGNDTITNLLYNRDEFILHSNVPINGRYITDPYRRTVLTFTQSDQQKGTLTLTGVDLTSVASQMPWLHWEGTSTTS